MNRRRFLFGAPTAALAVTAGTALATPLLPSQTKTDRILAREGWHPSEMWHERNGWFYRWTGWKSSNENAMLYGQWVAEQKDLILEACITRTRYGFTRAYSRAFSTSGGNVDVFNRGEVFDCGTMAAEFYVDLMSTEEHKDAVCAKALERLIKFIDSKGAAS